MNALYIILGLAALFLLVVNPKFGLFVCLLTVLVYVIQRNNLKRRAAQASKRKRNK